MWAFVAFVVYGNSRLKFQSRACHRGNVFMHPSWCLVFLEEAHTVFKLWYTISLLSASIPTYCDTLNTPHTSISVCFSGSYDMRCTSIRAYNSVGQ